MLLAAPRFPLSLPKTQNDWEAFINQLQGTVSTVDSGDVAWTPGAIASGSAVSTSVTIGGLNLGDYCLAQLDVSLNGCQLTCNADSANTAVAVISNSTGSTQTLPAASLSVRVFKNT